MRTPSGYSRPPQMGHGFSLGLPARSSVWSTSQPLCKTSQSRFPAHVHDGHQEHFHGTGNKTLGGVKNHSKGSGATPTGSLARPHENPTKKYSLHSSASAPIEARGLLSRISVRGTLTDVLIENIRMQVEASNSTPYPIIRTVLVTLLVLACMLTMSIAST